MHLVPRGYSFPGLPVGLPTGLPTGLSFPHWHDPRSIWDEPELNGAMWHYAPHSGGCCEFCDAWETTPESMDLLEELSLYDPHGYSNILQLYDSIHGHYMMGYDRDGSESYYLSRELAKLAKILGKDYRRNPWNDRGFGDIASHLKYMSSEMLVGPRRRRYHCLPRQRYNDDFYFPGARRRRYGRR